MQIADSKRNRRIAHGTFGGVSRKRGMVSQQEGSGSAQVPTNPVHVHGVIASFSSNKTDGTQFSLAVSPILAIEEPSLWESTVTIVGIVLSSVIAVTALVFAIYHRTCQRQLHKYDMAMQDESPKHVCKTTCPSHVSSHGIETEHCTAVSLIGGLPNGKKKNAYTHGSTNLGI